MEYKKELMEISRVLYQDMNNKEIKNDVDITFKQNKLMEILLKRIANQSLKNEQGNGTGCAAGGGIQQRRKRTRREGDPDLLYYRDYRAAREHRDGIH